MKKHRSHIGRTRLILVILCLILAAAMIWCVASLVLKVGSYSSRTVGKQESVDPAPAEPTPSPAQSETVYITQTGKKYHRAGCRHLQKSQIPISLDDAKAKGYTACKSCGG